MSGGARRGLLAMAVTFSAGLHAGLVPEHLAEMRQLGYAFIVAGVVGMVIAWALIQWPDDRRLPALGGIFLLGEIASWGLFVTVPVPFFPGTPEPVETIALVSKAVELLGVVVALSVIAADRAAPSGDRQSQARPMRLGVNQAG